jgi:hypothetical protein
MNAISHMVTYKLGRGTIHSRFFTMLVTSMTRWHNNRALLIMMGMVTFDRGARIAQQRPTTNCRVCTASAVYLRPTVQIKLGLHRRMAIVHM